MSRGADEHRLAGGFLRLMSWYSLADGVATLLNVAGMLLTVRALSVEEFGVADFLRTGQWFLLSLFSLNIFDSATRFYFDTTDPEERRRILGGGLVVYLLSGFAAGAVVMLCAPLSRKLLPVAVSARMLWLVALGIPASNLMTALTQTAVIRASARFYAGLVISQAVLVLLGISVLVMGMRLGLDGYFLALLLAAGVAGIVGYFLQARQYRWNWLIGPLKHYISFGAPSMVTEMMHYGFGLFSRVVLLRWASAVALGWYGFAERLQIPMHLTVVAAGRVWVPWLLAERPVPRQPVNRQVRQLNGFVLVILGVVVIFLRELILVIGGARYQRAYTAALLLLIAKWILFIGDYIVSASLTVAKQTHHRLWVFAIAYGAAALVGLWTIARWGSTGVAMTMVVASTLILLGMRIASASVYPLKHDLRRLIPASGLALGLAVWGSMHASLWIKPVFLAAYLLSLWRLGLFPAQGWGGVCSSEQSGAAAGLGDAAPLSPRQPGALVDSARR